MAKKPKRQKAIEAFRKAGGVLTMSEALDKGIHRRQLYSLKEEGELEVLDRGLYRLTEMPDPAFPDFVPVVKKIPRGVICLVSALAFHEITTQIPHFVYVALPASAHSPVISYPPMRYFWYADKLLKTGVEEHQIDGLKVRIFDVEKTLVDCVKFRNKIGMDIVLEALRMYWRSKKANINKLFKYAKMFRVEKVLKPIMEVIVSI
ncbi:MAG: type IV toxin-antitoxin system AbiEi family antitoxin domain-containing protein [Verrucomicrobia bacterium]|nr:type IV toxin-antitoxin system AbiEi family antitoxin domain-containing protein [Verrucomicrobiota bacterium]